MEQDNEPQGDPEQPSLEARLSALGSRLYGRALKLTHNEADADDLVQDTILRAIEHAQEWNGMGISKDGSSP